MFGIGDLTRVGEMKIILAVFLAASSFGAVTHADRLIYEDQIGGWIFSTPTELTVSSDEKLATIGRGPWFGMIDLTTGELMDGIPKDVQFSTFFGENDNVAFITTCGIQTGTNYLSPISIPARAR